MTRTYDVIFKGGTVVNHDGAGRADVGVTDGRIAFVGDLAAASAGETVDCAGLHVLPGVIDSQVHFREPGPTHKEDLETGSLAAVMGGVTCVFEMPNTNPLTTTPEAMADKVERAKRMHCDHAFYMGATHDNAKHMAELERLPGVCGIKIFMGASTGDLLIPDDEGVREVMKHGVRRIAIHSEDEEMLREAKANAREGDWSSHPDARPAAAALRCTERVLKLARETGRRVHVLHISTAEEMPLLAKHKDIATVEATPQHLTLDDTRYADMKGRLQMNPPIRSAAHRDGLWWGIAQGVVDVVGSDHAPHTLEEKARPYPASPSGMPGVQTIVPVMLNHVAEGRLSLARVVDLLCHGPQRVFGIAGKGRLAVGYDADLTVVDLKRMEEATDAWSASKSGWTPFAGMRFTGWPVGTIVRGRRVMWEGALEAAATGEPARFVETLGA